jgi:hypothetical protein
MDAFAPAATLVNDGDAVSTTAATTPPGTCVTNVWDFDVVPPGPVAVKTHSEGLPTQADWAVPLKDKV